MEIIQNIDKAISVMYQVGVWMNQNHMPQAQWFQPQDMNPDFLLKHTEPNEYYVGLVDGSPAASMILQETERNQSWKSIDGTRTQPALYIHWLCVAKIFTGQGLAQEMIDFAAVQASQRGYKLLRLDTDAKEEKLRTLFEDAGFKLMGTELEKDYETAFYQKSI